MVDPFVLWDADAAERSERRWFQVVIAVLVLALVGLATVPAFSHEAMGRKEAQANPELHWLHGKALRDGGHYKKGQMINCCTLGGSGDCVEVPCPLVSERGGVEGYALSEGEWVPAEDATLSPDGRCYRCKNTGQPSHCLFTTRARF